MIVFKKPLLCRNQKLMKKIYYTIIAALYFSQNLWANQDSTLLNSSSSTADTSKSQNIAIDTIDIGEMNFAAYDIEADSSHGDFPVGKKNYQKLAN